MNILPLLVLIITDCNRSVKRFLISWVKYFYPGKCHLKVKNVSAEKNNIYSSINSKFCFDLFLWNNWSTVSRSVETLEEVYQDPCIHMGVLQGLWSLLSNCIQVSVYMVWGASSATLSRCVILLCPWSLLNNCILVSIGSMEPLEQRYPGEWLQGPWYLLRKCIHVNIWSMEPLEQLYPCEYNVHGNSCAAVSMWIWGPLSLFNNCFQVSIGFIWSLLNNYILVSIGSIWSLLNNYILVSIGSIWSLLNNCIQVSIWSMEPLEQRYPGEYRIHGASWTTVSRWV